MKVEMKGVLQQVTLHLNQVVLLLTQRHTGAQ
jgi:hypothetical protein